MSKLFIYLIIYLFNNLFIYIYIYLFIYLFITFRLKQEHQHCFKSVHLRISMNLVVAEIK